MDRYGRAQEGSQPDPALEWTGSGPETGLEEGVWQLGLGEAESEYPERPNEQDCMYYLRTGICGYGARCRYNHPRDRSAVLGPARVGGVEYPERVGQPLCQYYMRTGTCKFGASCKYHHPKQGGGSASPVLLNYYGYPLRPGERECTYYIKTGQCKFGATCKFHHPQPGNIQIPAQSPAPQIAPVPGPTLYPSVQSPSVPSSQQYGVMVARPPLLPGSYVQGPYGTVLLSPKRSSIPKLESLPGTSMEIPLFQYILTIDFYSLKLLLLLVQAPGSPVASPNTQPAVSSGSVYGMSPLSPSAPAYTGAFQYTPPATGPSSSTQKEHLFPERPGQPECQYYIKNGDCKFRSSCRYHHPPELVAPNVVLSPIGLPLRPGAPTCTHYTQRGQCKFGSACKFNHPIGTLSYSPSASSLADMPVAPYLVGSSIGTLAPSSSSSDLRSKPVSGPGKDSSSTRLSSSTSAPSGSVGSIFSKSGPAPHSNVQQSDWSSGPSTSSSSGTHSSI
ncbi:ZINC FINGER CCCH DOMAIN-CONTAINING PROTEIN 58 [Salix purpurea]|uniref:ZINC FINGER CCCH DOMAIN-CONTAINING PROTEIN 58 n=1 Tax=Salix purpurea TaxID=77065 RepID=A0A9Q0Z8R0_SALPP|nr:ZINC FINGER CCCH DOMAIN-CONTAINING PROTEIN 58 [Salix purpurea]